jgi:hypothetical protein
MRGIDAEPTRDVTKILLVDDNRDLRRILQVPIMWMDLSPSLLVTARKLLKRRSRETELDPHGLCNAGYDWGRGDKNLATDS